MALKKNDVKPVSYKTIIKNKTLGMFFKVNEEDEEETKRFKK